MKFYSFQIVIKKEEEDEGYYAYVPELPGCFSNGKTAEDTRINIREAVIMHLDSLLAQNLPIDQNGKTIHVEELTVGMPD